MSARMPSLAAVVFLAAVGAPPAAAQETAGVSGSRTQFPVAIELAGKDGPIRMKLTGVALRKKLIFNVYAIGSYVQADAPVGDARRLAAVDTHKLLHLVMERAVSGKEMAASVVASITANHPESEFPAELAQLRKFMSDAGQVKKGEQVTITHVPERGTVVTIGNRGHVVIENPKFSTAVWDIYLGPKNIGAQIKKDLVSRL